jgi:putative endonuclease
MTSNQPWYLYVVECTDGTLYTGISTDVARRLREHNAGRGARYTAARRPVTLRASWHFQDRRAAMLAETSLKRMSRDRKKRLLEAAGEFRDGVWDLRR